MLNSDSNKWPTVTIILPVHNEARYVSRCLEALVEQLYPASLEILVVDGMSDDATAEVTRAFQSRYQNIRLLTNERRQIAAGLNIGLRSASGEIVVRVDARAQCPPDYLRRVVQTLSAGEAENVGGIQRAVGDGYWARSIAAALNSRYAVGGASFRYTRKKEYADTVYLGAWRRRDLENLRGWDEHWDVNEDYELNTRLRRAGGRILVDPGIQVSYLGRESLRLLGRQYFRYGLWRVKTFRRYPTEMRVSHLGPLALGLGVAAGALGVVSGLLSPWPVLAAAALYAMLQFLFGVIAARSMREGVGAGLAISTIHLSWSAGFWVGTIRFGFPVRAVAGALYRLASKTLSNAWRRRQ